MLPFGPVLRDCGLRQQTAVRYPKHTATQAIFVDLLHGGSLFRSVLIPRYRFRSCR
ncbi:hypothetical protein MSKU15_0694 [Komagataeibacter diospyri]|uniref:Uncharacterized protein n=1 Tax=Komagataeibacter diospyri TaxID=1932662 RepID=A0A4P5NZK5_9PROT|nr:hypothetical protein MSKU9_3226 [Komagataeibacter diospyri]GCE89093.1 hypothetical protein MSKU15_0694 [Komagataeibacter diospyri]